MKTRQPATAIYHTVSEMGPKPDVLGQVLAQRRDVTARLTQIRFVVAVMSGKGGVGKSALTANLAAALAMNGRSVGVLDADIHGPSAAAMLGARGQQVIVEAGGARPAVGMAGVRVMSMDLFLQEEGLPVVWKHPGGLAADTFVWRGTLEANVLREFLADTCWGDLDFLLIDMPPGTDRLETLLRLVPELSGVLAVTIPSQVSHMVVRRSITAAKQSQTCVLGLIENMAGLTGENGVVTGELFSGGQGESFAEEMGIPYLGKIPFDSLLARTTDSGRPFVLENGDRPAGQAILTLARKIEESITT